MDKSKRLNVPLTVDWKKRKSQRRHVLEWLIENNQCKTMVEIGVRYGGTSFYLLNSFPDLILYGIDTDITQFYSQEIQEKYGDRLIAIQGSSHTVNDLIPDNSIDIIFIDGDHSYEAVKKDIALYLPKLKNGGLLTGHDIDYPGVNQAVNEIIDNYDVAPNYVWFKKITR